MYNITLQHIHITTVNNTKIQHCHKNATPCYLCTAAHVAINNINPFRVIMGMQTWIFCTLLLSYKTFYTVVNNTEILRSSYKVPDIFVSF